MPKQFFCFLALLVGCTACFVLAHQETKSQCTLEEMPQKPTDELRIKEAIYRDLVGKRREGIGGTIGAYFLEASKEEKAHLQSVFTNWSPRVEIGETNNVIITKTGVVDRITSKPSTLFWARLESKTNSTARAKSGWHSGPEAGGTFKYQLRLDGTNWVIQSKERGLIW